MDRRVLEICVDTAAGLDAAIAGGADRIELCSALDVGGLTPTPGLIAYAALVAVPVYAMIRPRPDDFVFNAKDLETMIVDIAAMRAAGLAGVVLGASRPDGRLDVAVLEALAAEADGMGTTLHRAFDLVPDFDAALETAVELRFERVLTSGGAATASEGIEMIARVHERAAGRIGIMAGSGVTAATAPELLEQVALTELHSSGSVTMDSQGEAAQGLGFARPTRKVTQAESVAALKGVLARC